MNEQDIELLRKVLKEHGQSLTTARRTICEALWDHEPQTMRQLIDRTQGKVNRASLYRTIELFEKLGLVNRIYIGWKYKIELSDTLTHHHHHVSCVQCGKVTAIREEQAVEKLIHALAQKYGVTPQQHQLEIQGVCTDCQTKAPTKLS